MKSICLINVFFGQFPWYFNLFLKSCSHNSSIKFIIFTDQEKENISENIVFIPFTLQKFNNLASEKLGFKINIENAYKLCDLKPAYGFIFSEFIQKYDYWGITDIDIVFGRIREFITDELLNMYDVISVRHDYPTGSFMIFKNNENVNTLFKKSKDYKKVFCSQKHYCFDECNFEHNYLEDGGDIFDIKTEIESMHHILMKEKKSDGLKVHFDFFIIEGQPGNLYWNNGVLLFNNEFEILLYHLILYKNNLFSLKRNWKNVHEKFYIDKYLIRKKGYLSKIDFFFNEKFRIWCWQNLLYFEAFLSRNFYYSQMKGIPQLKYISGNQERYISNKNNLNFISSVHNSNDVLILCKSIFRKNVFFIKNFKNIYYELSSDQKFLLEIQDDGRVLKLILE